MSIARRTKRISRREDRLSSRSDSRSRRDGRRLAMEPLAARLVLSAVSQFDLPDDVGRSVPALIAEHHHGPHGAGIVSIGPGSHLSSRESGGARDGGPEQSFAPRGRFGPPASAGPRHDNRGILSAAAPGQIVVVGLVAPPSPFAIGLILSISRAPATQQAEMPASMEPAMLSVSAELEPAEIAASFVGSAFEAANATQNATRPTGVFAIPATPLAPNSTDDDIGRPPEAILTPDNTPPADTLNDGGLIELESPRTRRGGTLPSDVVDDAWQSTDPLDFEDPLDLDWLWPEPEALADDEPGDEASEDLAAEEDESDDAMTEAGLAEIAQGSQGHDVEGGMIELAAGEAIVELPNPATAQQVDSIADSEVRMEAGVALVRVFDLAAAPGEAASSEAASAPPAELPPAEETTSGKPSQHPHRSPALTGAMLMAIPFARRRPKRDDASEKPPRG